MTAAADLLRAAYDAANARDLEALTPLIDPDFEMDLSDRVFNPAIYHGEDGLRRFFAEIDDMWIVMRFEVDRVLERPGEALAVVSITLQGRGSGIELVNRVAQRWWLRDGRLLRMRGTTDLDGALAEFEAS